MEAMLKFLRKIFPTNSNIQKGNALTDLFSDKEMWGEPHIIFLALEVVSDFGKVLEENSWMLFGAPESLLQFDKKTTITSFEILHLFLENSIAQKKFKEMYPDFAHKILNNEFYNNLKNCLTFVETFIPDEDALYSINFAKILIEKNGEVQDRKQRDYLINNGEIVKKNYNLIIENTNRLLKYFNEKGLFIKEKIFE